MIYVNYAKQNENSPDCVIGHTYGANEHDRWCSYFHFIAKQEITLLKQQLTDINFNLYFDLGDRNSVMLLTLHPSLSNKGVILPGGARIIPYRYRELIEIKLISFVEDVVIKPGDIILESIGISGLIEIRNTVLRKHINPVDTKLCYMPDVLDVDFEDINIIVAQENWRKGIKDKDLLNIYPEGHEIYKDIEFGIQVTPPDEKLEKEPKPEDLPS